MMADVHSSREPDKDPSKADLLVEVAALRQRVAELEQDKLDMEIMLEMTTDYADDLSESLEQERHDLETMLEITADHGDDLSEALEQERDDLVTMLEMASDHADAIEADLQHKADELEAHNQFVRDTFGRYVSDDVVAQLLDSPEGLELGGEKRQVTILMSDLRGFTAVAERLDPQEVMTFLNRYLDAMVNIILSYRGTIIEILGDGLLVLFGAPIQQDDDAERAVACALAMQLQMEGVNVLLRQEGLPEVEMGIGIHTGDAVVGNIGSQQRTKYGVVGSTVNLTGRIESYTTGSQVLISPSTYQETAAILEIRHEMTVEPKGVIAPITIYEVSGLAGEHQLFLPDSSEVLVPLDETISVRYTVLEGKFAGDTVFTGRLMKMAKKAAELHTDHPVDVFSNLKMQIMRDNGDSGLGDLFAKVLAVSAESPYRVVIGFTSIPDETRALFDPVMRYEYHLINRSVQGFTDR